VWTSFDVREQGAGLDYQILPTGMTAASFWLIRLPYIGKNIVRKRILSRATSKL
jgi:hypothetical protein